jgi:tetratricopeptide (TPR) repeat protein
MAMPHFALPLALMAGLGNLPAELVVILALVLLAAFVGGGIGFWRLYGSGPRRYRAYGRVHKLLQKGDWHSAQALLTDLRNLGPQAGEWEGRLNNLEGECQRAAGEAALAEGNFEAALECHLSAAKLLHTNPDEARSRVLENMLADLRQSVAADADEQAAKLAARILRMQPSCAEASFWQGWLYLRQSRLDLAETPLRSAQVADKKSVEPTLYLGMLLVRGEIKRDGLRYLAEANRMAPNSPLIGWQVGSGLLTSGGDAGLALRALQKAAGPDGLPKLAGRPDSFWREALPEGSWIGKAADGRPFTCPLLGGNIPGMVRQAKMALGQALVRQDRTVEAVGVFRELVNEAEPTVGLLRALGISLCRLEQFDEAYAHLKAAYEREETQSPQTTCYLAYSAVNAKPNRPEDGPANARWALRLLADFAIPIEAELARVVAVVFAEACRLGVSVPEADRLRLCDTLAALNAADDAAAGAYDQLAGDFPGAVRPPHAFLYGRVALNGFRGQQDLDLLERVFKNVPAAEEFYQAHGWKLQDIERLYLERWAEARTGFPPVFGPEYPARCELILLDQAKLQESAGDGAAARATIDLLRRLIPANTATFDQLARLAWRQGEREEAARLLRQWLNEAPDNPTPHVRLAVMEQERGNGSVAAEHVSEALGRSSAPARTQIALLGAKLELKDGQVGRARELLAECLRDCPNQTEALWLQAALSWRDGNAAELARLAPAMNQAGVADPRFHFIAAVCQMHSGDFTAATESARLAGRDSAWNADAEHLAGAIALRCGQVGDAIAQLAAVMQVSEVLCADHARALLGRAQLEKGDYSAAAESWQGVPPAKREAWGLTPALRGLAFLAGVQALHTDEPDQAAQWLIQARKLGSREAALPTLQEWAVLEAARRALSAGDRNAIDALCPSLEQISRSRGANQWPAALLLARVHRQANRLAEAREVLRRPGPHTPAALLQIGLIAVHDAQLTQAEEAFARVLEREPGHPVAAVNLFWTRLSLGQTDAAREELPALIENTPDEGERRLLIQFQVLLKGAGLGSGFADITDDDEARLLGRLLKLGRLETTVPLLCLLAAARPNSRPVKDAQLTGMIRLGKQRFDRGDWLGTEKWLSPLAKARPTASVRNLLGIVACLTQDYSTGILHLQEALRLAGDDPRIHQNLALAFTWLGDFAESGLCWGRFLGTMSQLLPRPPGFIDYHEQLRFHVLRYLGNQNYERERWTEALAFVEQALRLQPDNPDLAERLFLLQIQAGQRGEAGKTLQTMRQLKPNHPPFELFELDLIEVRTADDLENLIEAFGRVIERIHGEPGAQEKAVLRVLPTLQYRADQLTRQMREIREDLRRLHEDSAGWYDALRDLRAIKRHLRRLRQIVRYCASLPIAEAQRRCLDEMNEDLERKIEYCRRWEDED